jgi:hypothetical protein
VKRSGKIGDTDRGIDQVDLVAGDLSGIKNETCCGHAGAEYEFATGETGRRGAALRSGHGSMITAYRCRFGAC